MIIFIKNFLKKILRYQHIYLPLPLFAYRSLFKYKVLHNIFYKYYILCFDTDFNYKKENTTEQNQKYWLSKRSLYWHFTHLYNNRFNERFKEIYQNHRKLFDGKCCCDLMAGVGSVYLINKLDLKEMIFIEKNKYCCEFLRKNFSNSKIINEDWKYIEKISNNVDTLILISGCLIYLDEKDIENFFKATKNIKNMILINDGTYLDDFKVWSGHNYWNLKKRLKKYNNYYKTAKFYTKESDSIYRYFVMEG